MGFVIRVGNRSIGQGKPVFVIAEVGCNHENDFGRAREMVVAAARAGADAVKFQSFTTENLVTQDAPKFWDIAGPGETQYAEFVEAQPRFDLKQYQELFSLAKQQGILFFSTPCDETWADFLEQLGVSLFKIASMDLTHQPLLKHVARKGKPIVLSTGASTLEEIRTAVRTIQGQGNNQIALLHCISNYPTQPEHVNLRMMQHLKQEFPDCVIGYSDHTLPHRDPSIPVLAVAASAQVIEKHFTFDSSRPGYDHLISADYEKLSCLVAEFRQVEKILGRADKAPLETEQRTRRWGRRSVVAATDIPKGVRILPDMVAIKRPGTGIEPEHLAGVLGKTARCDIPQDRVLTWDLVEEPRSV